jgi:PAS domain S-box-containing protein
MARRTGTARAHRARGPGQAADESVTQMTRPLAVPRSNSDLRRPAARRSPRMRWLLRTIVASRAPGADRHRADHHRTDHHRADNATPGGKGLKSSVMFHLGGHRWKRRDHRIGFAPDDGRRRELGRVRPSLSFALPVPPRLLACLAIVSISVLWVSSIEAQAEPQRPPSGIAEGPSGPARANFNDVTRERGAVRIRAIDDTAVFVSFATLTTFGPSQWFDAGGRRDDTRSLRIWRVAEASPTSGPAASAAPSLWAQHERLILIAIIVIAIESALLAALLVQILRRRRAERALKESEERWRSVFETSAAGVAVLDRDARLVATNLAFQAMLGYSDPELRTVSLVDLGFPDDRDTLRRLGDELRRGAHPRHDAVTQFRRRDGSAMWSHIYFSSILDHDSKPRLIIATALDVTDHKAAEEAARTAQSELAQVARLTAMGEMSASIAHEINQPLAAIVANGNAGLRWLANTAPDLDEVRATLKRIVSDGHRAGKVISGVRTIFKKDVQARGPIDVNDLIGEVLSLVRGELESRRVTVETELGQLPSMVADRAQLQQVILNLITNALDAMGAISDRPRVLRLRSERCEPGKIMVTVHDSGPGIEKKNIHRIFEPFFTTKSNGTGMGLSICRSVVESHGGQLMASHGHPYGAVFQIALPIQEPDVGGPASANGQLPVEIARR